MAKLRVVDIGKRCAKIYLLFDKGAWMDDSKSVILGPYRKGKQSVDG
jgi:hypothetical protein